VARRVSRLTDLVEQLTAQRAEERVGDVVDVLVEQPADDGHGVVGRALHQGPDVDGTTTLPGELLGSSQPAPGQVVRARVVRADGVDLVAEPLPPGAGAEGRP